MDTNLKLNDMDGFAVIFAATIIGASIYEGCSNIADAIRELIEEPEEDDETH